MLDEPSEGLGAEDRGHGIGPRCCASSRARAWRAAHRAEPPHGPGVADRAYFIEKGQIVWRGRPTRPEAAATRSAATSRCTARALRSRRCPRSRARLRADAFARRARAPGGRGATSCSASAASCCPRGCKVDRRADVPGSMRHRAARGRRLLLPALRRGGLPPRLARLGDDLLRRLQPALRLLPELGHLLAGARASASRPSGSPR